MIIITKINDIDLDLVFVNVLKIVTVLWISELQIVRNRYVNLLLGPLELYLIQYEMHLLLNKLKLQAIIPSGI